MYHRIAEPATDPWGLCVSPRHFAEHVEVLSGSRHVVHFRDVARAVRSHRLLRNAVAITFDDGYVDNLEQARPALEHHDMPATVFVTSGYVGATVEFWWDQLERLLLEPGTLPSTLPLLGREAEHWIEVGAARTLTEHQSAVHRGWRARTPPPTPRHGLYLQIWTILKHRAPAERSRALARLTTWVGSSAAPRPTVRPMTAGEINAIASGGLIDIGAHSKTHASLPNCPPADQRHEIEESRRALEEIVHRPVTSFSYPYGEHDTSTLSYVRDAGYTGACTIHNKTVRGNANALALPRFTVLDWDGDAFAEQLARFSHR